MSLIEGFLRMVTFFPIGAHKSGLDPEPNKTIVDKPHVAIKCIGPVSLPIAYFA
jgi:hypothetical protein